MDRHIAFNALAVILRRLTSHQRGVILGQPIGHLALRSYHCGLQRAQVPPSGSSASCSALLGARSVVVRRELWHMVFNGDFPRGSVVKLDGEGGMTLSCGADNAVLQCLSPSVSYSCLEFKWRLFKPMTTVLKSTFIVITDARFPIDCVHMDYSMPVISLIPVLIIFMVRCLHTHTETWIFICL